ARCLLLPDSLHSPRRRRFPKTGGELPAGDAPSLLPENLDPAGIGDGDGEGRAARSTAPSTWGGEQGYHLKCKLQVERAMVTDACHLTIACGGLIC
ncbi:Os08g0234200, partial [Oryza sativa Japonica Group]